MNWLDDFISLFYPRLCAGCGIALVRGEEVICLNCLADLPKTNFHKVAENPVQQLFVGRTTIVGATSFCHFDKGGRVQHLLHELKYKGNFAVGQKMGYLMGCDLIENELFCDVDAIVPVPLHPKREKIRGYNQSAAIGAGLSRSMNRPMVTDTLIRPIGSLSQTRKGRYERWENVNGIFRVNNQDIFAGKHLLLVDDVVTTGSTIEACCVPLLQIAGVRVSVATLACA